MTVWEFISASLDYFLWVNACNTKMLEAQGGSSGGMCCKFNQEIVTQSTRQPGRSAPAKRVTEMPGFAAESGGWDVYVTRPMKHHSYGFKMAHSNACLTAFFILREFGIFPQKESGDFLDLKTMKNTLIFQEMESEKSQEWFSFKRDKFISHVDTFYYSVKTRGDWLLSLGARSLVGTLKKIREEADKKREPQPFMEDDVFSDLVINPFHGARMYKYGITKADCFDIFIAENVPNALTPAIHVQLRSQFIWLKGLKDAFYESLVYLYGILDRYGIEIASIKENRIDYAYHTNYIQDMLSFFSDKNLGEMQVSSFKRWSKEGNFLGSTMYNDYISLGRRKSNSVFVRIYNKSKEVIEMGYKQFFVPIWRQQGLISSFDQYIFEKVFEDGNQSWNYKEVARCLFYLEHGRDDEIKSQIHALMGKIDASAQDFKKLADGLVPDLTDIVNIEIQTKRKFYHDFIFPKIQYPDWVPVHELRIYKILHMLQSVRDFLTYDTIRFVKYKGKYAKVRRERRPVAEWWKRLSACGELDGISYDLCKEYQCKYDVFRSKRRSLSSMASLATILEYYYHSNIDKDFTLGEDMSDIMSHFNDNDFERYAEFRSKKRNELKARYGAHAAPVVDQAGPVEEVDVDEAAGPEYQTIFKAFWEGL